MAARVADDFTAEQFHARAENHLEFRARGEHSGKARDSIKRGGQIGIPEAHKLRVPSINGLEHAPAYGFSFTAVPLKREYGRNIGKGRAHPFKKLPGLVPAAVIHEQQPRGIPAC
jgi:hypothetical protein